MRARLASGLISFFASNIGEVYSRIAALVKAKGEAAPDIDNSQNACWKIPIRQAEKRQIWL
jgi:hypothetical protein